MIQQITPSTPITKSPLSSQFNSPLAPTLRAPYAPLVSSPLKPSTSEGGQHLALLGSPRVPITIAPEPSQRNSPLAPVASAQNSIPLQTSPLAAHVSRRILRIKFRSTLTPSAIAQRPAVSLSSSRSPVANSRGSSEQLDSMSATAAIKQDPTNQNGSLESLCTDAPCPSRKLLPASATSTSTIDAQGVSLPPSPPSVQPGSLIAPTVSTQPASLPIVPDPSVLQVPGSTGNLVVVCMCERLKRGKAKRYIQQKPPLASTLITLRPSANPPTNPPVASGSASAPAPALDLFRRSVSFLNLALGALY